jgi:hypothetical protein
MFNKNWQIWRMMRFNFRWCDLQTNFTDNSTVKGK